MYVQKQFDAGPFNSRAEEAADFGCLVGGGDEMMPAKKPWSVPEYSGWPCKSKANPKPPLIIFHAMVKE